MYCTENQEVRCYYLPTLADFIPLLKIYSKLVPTNFSNPPQNRQTRGVSSKTLSNGFACGAWDSGR